MPGEMIVKSKIFWTKELPLSLVMILTLKAPSKICSRRHSIFYIFFYFSEKTSLAWQTIHMKFQDLFSLKNKKEN